MLPNKIMVTNQEIDLSKLTKLQENYFLSLAEHIKNKYLDSGLSRYVIGISGPSGSGKSVLAVILEELLKEDSDFTCQTIDLDAFHLSNDELAEKNLLNVKGRYDTYNTDLLNESLKLFKNNEEVQFPHYSRKNHEPYSDGPIVHQGNTILLLPGLWLQRNDANWSEIRKYIDYTITLEGSQNTFKQNTIDRHVRGGRSRKEAEVFYNNSDKQNSNEILQNSVTANLTLPYYENILSPEDINFK